LLVSLLSLARFVILNHLLAGLMARVSCRTTQVEPVWGDLSSRFSRIADLTDMVLRLSAFFRLSISHLGPISASNSLNFLGAYTLQSLSQLCDVIDLDESLSSLALVKLSHVDLRMHCHHRYRRDTRSLYLVPLHLIRQSQGPLLCANMGF
jgi:hypothetical protein